MAESVVEVETLEEKSLANEIGDIFDELSNESADEPSPAKKEPVAEDEKGTEAEEREKDEARAARAAEQKREKETGKFAGGKRRLAKPAEGQEAAPKPAAQTPEQQAAAAAATQAQQTPEQQAAAADAKPPPSLKAFARGDWDKAPASIRAEFWRREREVNSALQQSAGARQATERLVQTIAPFEAMIRAEQAGRGEQYDPFKTVQSLLGTAALLRTGTVQQKASLIAKLVVDYGLADEASLKAVDAAVAGALGGRAPQQQQFQPQAQQPYHDPRVDRLLGEIEQNKRSQIDGAISQFASDAKHDLFPDVKVLMGNLMASAAQAGLTLSMEDAYQQAVRIDPNTRKVVEQREQAERVRNARASTSTSKRAAATGLKPAPAGTTKPSAKGGSDLRSDIESVVDDLDEE